MGHPLTFAENKLDKIAERYEGLMKTSLLICSETPIIKHAIETQIAFDKKRYETAFETCVNIVMKYYHYNRTFAENYVKIARQLRIEDPQGFKERVDAASQGFANFLDKNNVIN
jgi:hypothetical protein